MIKIEWRNNFQLLNFCFSPAVLETLRLRQESARIPLISHATSEPSNEPQTHRPPPNKKPRIEEKKSYRIEDLLNDSKPERFNPISTSTPVKLDSNKDGNETVNSSDSGFTSPTRTSPVEQKQRRRVNRTKRN